MRPNLDGHSQTLRVGCPRYEGFSIDGGRIKGIVTASFRCYSLTRKRSLVLRIGTFELDILRILSAVT